MVLIGSRVENPIEQATLIGCTVFSSGKWGKACAVIDMVSCEGLWEIRRLFALVEDAEEASCMVF